MSEARFPWWMTPAAILGAGLVLALGATWRLRRVGIAERDTRLAHGERCIFAFWHARLLPLVFTHRGRSIVVLSGRHRDAELVVRIINRLGFLSARGSSTRGASEALRSMMRFAEEGRLLAMTPDGPRGPAERVKSGLVYLASRTGLPVVPVATAAAREWRLPSWDGFRVPRPFARVVVAYGDPVAVPRELGDGEIETWRERLEQAVGALTADVDRLIRDES